jgi:probable phosphoglycerate mutase
VTDLLLIRHGETAWNAEKRLQGHLDIDLNEVGRRQARALARILRDEPLDGIFASDLSRARETAQHVAALRGMEVHVDAGLRERCYGGFEGMLYADIEGVYPEAYRAWKARDIDARFPPGQFRAETMREFYERAVSAVTRIADSHRGRRLALVTHGGVLECAYRAAQNLGFDRPRDFDIFNASINRFSWDGQSLKLVHWGDTRHLAEAAPGAVALDEIDR